MTGIRNEENKSKEGNEEWAATEGLAIGPLLIGDPQIPVLLSSL